MNENNREIELKLEITAVVYRAIKKLPRAQTRQQVNYYFESGERGLNSLKLALRIRQQGSRFTMTLKGPASQNRGVFSRDEFEEEISKKSALAFIRRGILVSGSEIFPLAKLQEAGINERVGVWLVINNTRTSIPFHDLMLELDRSCVLNRVFYELEVETTGDRSMEVEKTITDWFNRMSWPMRFATQSKYEKARAIYEAARKISGDQEGAVKPRKEG